LALPLPLSGGAVKLMFKAEDDCRDEPGLGGAANTKARPAIPPQLPQQKHLRRILSPSELVNLNGTKNGTGFTDGPLQGYDLEDVGA
jgi:hypothetical protein